MCETGPWNGPCAGLWAGPEAGLWAGAVGGARRAGRRAGLWAGCGLWAGMHPPAKSFNIFDKYNI